MMRNIFVVLPALAIALPLTASAGETRWGGQGYEQGYEQTRPGDKGDTNLELMLEMCTAVQILAMDRACALSVRSSGEEIAVCEARFIPGKKPFQPGKKPVFPGQEPVFPDQEQVEQVYPGQEPVYPDQDTDHGGLIFVEVATCTALGIDVNIDR